MEIDGTANIYVKTDSDITSAASSDAMISLTGTVVREDMSLRTLTWEKEGDVSYVTVKSMADMKNVSWAVSYVTNLNIRLETDLDFSGEYASRILPQDYFGTFDGNGHTIANVDTETECILKYNLRGTVKNLVLKNCTQGWSSGRVRSGVICGNNYGTIENCAIEGVTVTTHKKDEESGNYYDLIKENGVFAGANFGTIQNCCAAGCDFSGEGENADVKPVLMETTHGTGYAAGYADGCTASGYSNTKSSAKPVHNLTYTADGNVLTGVCETDAEHKITVTLNAADAEYDGREHTAAVTTKCSAAWGMRISRIIPLYTREREKKRRI